MGKLNKFLYDILVESPINHEDVINILTFFVINTLLLGFVYSLVRIYTLATNKEIVSAKYDFTRVVSVLAADTVTVLLLSFATVLLFLQTGWYENTFIWFGTNLLLGLIGDILVSMTFNERRSIANYIHDKVSSILINLVDKFSKK